jgi:hypothetical protein
MERLAQLAAELKTAYGDQDAADTVMRLAAEAARKAQTRQAACRQKIIEELGHEEAAHVLDMLKAQGSSGPAASILSFKNATVIKQ